MARFTREDGYTLAELLIVIAMLGVMVTAVVGVYQVSLQTYTRASSLEDAQLGARAGLDRMATELRLIGAYWSAVNGGGAAITVADSTSITFLADIDADTLNTAGQEITLAQNANSGDTQIIVNRTTGWVGGNAFTAGEWVYIASGVTREVKQIAAGYTTGTALPLATALTNSYPGPSTPAIVRSVETVAYAVSAGSLARNGLAIVDNVTALTFAYFDVNGAPLALPPIPGQIREIQISLTTQGSDGSLRTMTSQVRPRNL